MRGTFLKFLALFSGLATQAQVLYYNGFNNLPLQSYTVGSSVYQYTTVPTGFDLINDGYINNAGTTQNPNTPFNNSSLQTIGWAVGYNTPDNDTFLVSTSWLDTTLAASRWITTPTVTNISANTVLTWMAKSPDPNYRDGYEVYGTNKTGVLTANDFTIGDKLFTLGDASTTDGGEKSTWYRRSIPLGSFSGQTLRFAYRNNSNDMFQLWIDDIEVKTLSNNLDGQVNSIKVSKYVLVNTNDTVFVNYTNLGASTIYSLTLNYTYGSSAVNSQLFTFASGLTYGQSVKLKFPLPFAFTSQGYYPVKCWASLVNNQPDQNSTNDTTVAYVTALASSPQKNVLIEQFVSANDPESPDAQEKLKVLMNNNIQYIVVNIHDNDSLKENNSSSLIGLYKKKSSTAMIDRVYDDSLQGNTYERTYYTSRASIRKNSPTPVAVSIINKSFNSSTKQLSFTVDATFSGEVKGDYRIAAYLTENWVCGKNSDTTVNGYNQLSNYFNVPWSPYYTTGYFSSVLNAWVLKANQFKHNRTLIYSFDNGFGTSGVIPQTGGTIGQSYQVTYSLTIPTSTNGALIYNPDNIYIIGFAAEYNGNQYMRDVLNCAQDKLTSNAEVVGIKETAKNLVVTCYPNPAKNELFLKLPTGITSCYVTINELSGRTVYAKYIINPGLSEQIDIHSLSPGIYILEVKTPAGNFNQKIIIENK